LGLDEEQGVGEVGIAQVGIPEIRADDVGKPQVRAAKTSTDEKSPSQVRPAEIGAIQAGTDEVCSPAVQLRPRNSGPHQFAGMRQQLVDIDSVRSYV